MGRAKRKGVGGTHIAARKRTKEYSLHTEKPDPSSSTFHSFTQLPLELQLRIWAIAAVEPRVVILGPAQSGGIASPAPIPPILHVSQQSREVGLKTYSLHFGTKSTPPRIYFNFTKDTLYIRRGTPHAFISSLTGLLKPEEHAQIRSLVIGLDSRMTNYALFNCLSVERGCNGFRGIKEVALGLERLRPKLDRSREVRLFEDLKERDLQQLREYGWRYLGENQMGKRPKGNESLDAIKKDIIIRYIDLYRSEEVVAKIYRVENW